MSSYRLGKKAARPGAVKLDFADYIDITVLPAPPKVFGHQRLVAGFPMLCNDIIGDCASGAGALHQTQLWCAEAGVSIPVSDKAAVANYSAITGYVRGPEISGFDTNGNAIKNYQAPPNPTDQGTDVPTLLKYWYATGIVDASNNRHKIGAALALRPGDWEQLWYASYYADGVAVGLQLPTQWQQAFTTHTPWTALANPDVEGGHYLAQVAWNGNAVLATWGGLAQLTQTGYEQASDETYALLSQEKLRGGVDLEGRNWSQLTADLPKLLDIDTPSCS